MDRDSGGASLAASLLAKKPMPTENKKHPSTPSPAPVRKSPEPPHRVSAMKQKNPFSTMLLTRLKRLTPTSEQPARQKALVMATLRRRPIRWVTCGPASWSSSRLLSTQSSICTTPRKMWWRQGARLIPYSLMRKGPVKGLLVLTQTRTMRESASRPTTMTTTWTSRRQNTSRKRQRTTDHKNSKHNSFHNNSLTKEP